MYSPPSDWQVKPLKELTKTYAGGTPSRNAIGVFGGLIPWVKSSELNSSKIYDTEEKLTQLGYLSSSAKWVPPQTPLIAMYGATAGVVSWLKIRAVTNQAVLAVLPLNCDEINVRWLYWTLNFYSNRLLASVQGSGQPNLSKSLIDDLLVLQPPYSEQHQIAEILDTIASTIAHTSTLIAKLKQMKAGLLHDLLTRGLDENGKLRDAIEHPEQFKDSPLGKIPRNWEVKTLGEIVESAVDGPFGSNLKTEHYVDTPGVRVVRLQNIQNSYFDDSDRAYISESHAKTLKRHEVVPGDLLVASLGDENHPIARACLYPNIQPGINKADCFRLRLQPSVNHSYVMYVLNCPTTRKDVDFLGQGVTRDRVNLTTLQKVRLRVPSLQEQTHIISTFTAHDARIRSEEAYLNKLKEQKKGLMHDLLTGRVRVTDLKEIPA